LLGLQAGELGPHRGDEQEGDHAGEQVDVGHKIQFGVKLLLAGLTASFY